MPKLFNPPKALLASGDKTGVFIGGALNMLSIDKDLNFHIASDLSSELSWGKFWEDPEISDQIETITPLDNDAEAIFDPAIMVERIYEGFENIIQRKQIFFGLASFEVNAFEASVYESLDLDQRKLEALMEAHQKSREIGFPKIQKGNFIQVSFVGGLKSVLELEERKRFTQIAAKITQKDASLVGLASVSQAAANFFILNSTVREKNQEVQENDEDNFGFINFAITGKQISPVSWFKIDMGLNSIKQLMDWEEIWKNPKFQNIKGKYIAYLKDFFQKVEKNIAVNSNEFQFEEIKELSEEERLKYIQDCKDAMKELMHTLKD